MIEQITPSQAADWTQQHLSNHQAPLLIDVREPWEWGVASITAPAGCELLQLSMGNIPGMLNRLDPDRPTALLCHHGVRSQNVANFLHHNGFSSVANIAGGIDAWSLMVDPGVARY